MGGAPRRVGFSVFFSSSFSFVLRRSKWTTEAERESRAIGGLDELAQADVCQLGAQRGVRKKTDLSRRPPNL